MQCYYLYFFFLIWLYNILISFKLSRPHDIIVGFEYFKGLKIKSKKSLSPEAILNMGWIVFNFFMYEIFNGVEKKTKFFFAYKDNSLNWLKSNENLLSFYSSFINFSRKKALSIIILKFYSIYFSDALSINSIAVLKFPSWLFPISATIKVFFYKFFEWH